MVNPGAALQAILFDHDGTLINSEAVHFKLWQQTLTPYGVELTDAYYNETMAGVPTSQWRGCGAGFQVVG
jgi:beta-phosphoglucomutase-like phosphatase (HAD superfamily)